MFYASLTNKLISSTNDYIYLADAITRGCGLS